MSVLILWEWMVQRMNRAPSLVQKVAAPDTTEMKVGYSTYRHIVLYRNSE